MSPLCAIALRSSISADNFELTSLLRVFENPLASHCSRLCTMPSFLTSGPLSWHVRVGNRSDSRAPVEGHQENHYRPFPASCRHSQQSILSKPGLME